MRVLDCLSPKIGVELFYKSNKGFYISTALPACPSERQKPKIFISPACLAAACTLSPLPIHQKSGDEPGSVFSGRWSVALLHPGFYNLCSTKPLKSGISECTREYNLSASE